MRYFLDTEFDGFFGSLISLALAPEDDSLPNFYAVYMPYIEEITDPWVKDNVMPILESVPRGTKIHYPTGYEEGAHLIGNYLKETSDGNIPFITSDWPSDIAHFSNAIQTTPGFMIDIPGLHAEVVRVDAYPTNLEGAIQHNAMWDALALKEIMRGQTWNLRRGF